jgi:hypothetical protein
VLETLDTQRLAQAGVILGVDRATGERVAVRADWRVAPRAAAPRLLVLADRREWTCPKLGAVSVTNTAGCSAIESGTPLPPRSPAAIRW